MGKRGPKLGRRTREALMDMIKATNQYTNKTNSELARILHVTEGNIRYWRKKVKNGYRDRRKEKASGVSRYDEIIVEWIRSNIKSPRRETVKILYEMLVEHHGYELSYDALRRYIKKHHPEVMEKPKRIRIETPPGVLMQLDWKEDIKVQMYRAGNYEIRNLLLGVMGFSRGTAAVVSRKRDMESFIWGNLEILKRFEGIPEVVRPDCMKTAVIEWKGRKSRITPEYSEYMKKLGIKVFPARPGTARDKGKVEKRIRDILDSTAFRRKIFRDDKELQEYIDGAITGLMKKWRAGSTGLTVEESLEYERKSMRRLPDIFPRVPASTRKTKVRQDGTVYFEKNYYQVHERHIGKKVTCMRYGNEVLIYKDGELIESSRALPGAEGIVMLSEKAIRESTVPMSDIVREWGLTVSKRQIEIYEEIKGGKR